MKGQPHDDDVAAFKPYVHDVHTRNPSGLNLLGPLMSRTFRLCDDHRILQMVKMFRNLIIPDHDYGYLFAFSLSTCKHSLGIVVAC